MIRDLVVLIRPRVSLAVAAGTWFGALYHAAPEGGTTLAVIGSFLLCGGCSALNQVQERALDRRMERTHDRPVAAGRLTAGTGATIGTALVLLGAILYFLAGGWSLLALGGFVVLVYNGVYTPLKRITPLALLAGGFAGSVPPLAGWLAAGGSVLEPRIVGVTAIFYLWQVPHFWLLAEKYKDDYNRAGFPVFPVGMSPALRGRVMGIWVAAYFVALGCLCWLHGPASLSFIAGPALLIVGGLAAGLARSGRIAPATVAMHGSLPVGLAVLLLNTLH